MISFKSEKEKEHLISRGYTFVELISLKDLDKKINHEKVVINDFKLDNTSKFNIYCYLASLKHDIVILQKKPFNFIEANLSEM